MTDFEKDFLPYTIHNFQISNFPDQLPNNYFKGPAYWVFWNGDIPLGSMFVEKSVFNGENFFLKDFQRSIAKAIQCYQEKNNFPKEPWGNYFDANDFKKFTSYILQATAWTKEFPENKVLPVSIIICTAGRPKDIVNCLQSIYKMEYQPAEIVIVDNKPGNPEMDLIKKQQPNIKWVDEPRIGLDIARNTGILNASNEIITYVDDDVEVHKMWLYHVWETFENPEVNASTGLVLPATIDTFSQFLFESFWSFSRGFSDFLYDQEFMDETLIDGPPVWKIGAGANMSFRKSFLLQCGGFDERLDAGAAGCNGDSECWFRILKKGGIIQYNPRSIVWHHHRKDMEGYYKQMYNYMKGFTAAALIQKKQMPSAGYAKYIFKVLVQFYKQLWVGRNMYFRLRKITMKQEIKGVIAGVWFYIFHPKSKLIKVK